MYSLVEVRCICSHLKVMPQPETESSIISSSEKSSSKSSLKSKSSKTSIKSVSGAQEPVVKNEANSSPEVCKQ